MELQKNWWEDFFREEFGKFMDRGNDPDTLATADFLMSELRLQPGDHIFDQCCGQGPLSLLFASKGLNVTGVDQAAPYIEVAKQKAVAQNLDSQCSFHAGDAFDYVVEPACDAAINWYSSFGYMTDDTQNVKMFERLYDSLKPGGRAAVEYMNVPQLLRDFQATYTRERIIDGQTIEFVKQSHVDLERGMIGSEWTYNLPDGQSVHSPPGESRLYGADDIRCMLEDSGFTDIKAYGEVDGSALSIDSHRCIFTALRPV